MIILVADDQRSQIELMARQLSSAGYEVVACRSGEEAIDRLKSQMVDLVITDMEMEGMTGAHLLESIRRDFGAVPVVLMSGNPRNLEVRGFVGYLEKPFSMRDLLTVVENALKKNA